MSKRTKIICTIGPASRSMATIAVMLKSGMDLARLNFSHGTHEYHAGLIKNIRLASKKTGKIVAIIADLQGPKIRVGDLGEKGRDLKEGETVVFTTGPAVSKKIPVGYRYLHKNVKAGERVLLDDGLMELKILQVRGRDIYCKVKSGGRLTSHKGMNLPDSRINLSSLTAKDKHDLFFAMSQGADFVAISFVRTAGDITGLKKLIEKNAKKLKVKKPKVIVKIETGRALQNFISILGVADAVMVARGDLAIETPAEDVPLRQKEIIALCRQVAKPVIVATQMLDSMIRNPRPTRAEVSDIANAVMDHADCLMLSGESANGKYPGEAVKTMTKVIAETENSPYDDVLPEIFGRKEEEHVLARAANILVRKTELKQIADFSKKSVYRHLLQGRPEADVFINIHNGDMYPCIFWGVRPYDAGTTDRKKAIAYLKRKKLLGRKYLLLGDGEMEIVD